MKFIRRTTTILTLFLILIITPHGALPVPIPMGSGLAVIPFWVQIHDHPFATPDNPEAFPKGPRRAIGDRPIPIQGSGHRTSTSAGRDRWMPTLTTKPRMRRDDRVPKDHVRQKKVSGTGNLGG